MTRQTVLCRREYDADADAVWGVFAAFDVAWHPSVDRCVLYRGEDGALRRRLQTADGGDLIEQRTYVSDSDRLLRYTAVSGFDGARSYMARIEVTPQDHGCTVTWQADIAAAADRVADIAAGTSAVFEAGLDALAKDLPPVKRARTSQGTAASLSTGSLDGVPTLTFLANDGDHDTLVLFLHGIGGQASNWADQLRAFGADTCVAALNLRGYGGSTLGFAPTQIDDYCDDILATMAHFNARRVVLVGLSYGSWIATSFAMRHPDRLAGLVLAGGCTGMSEADEAEREAFLQSRDRPLSQGQTPADFAPDVVSVIAGPNASDAVRHALHASMAAIPAATYRDALTCFTHPLERFDFARITCPVLLITGEHDRLAPPTEIRAVARRMHDRAMAARGVADVRFAVLPDAGHVCNLEQPDAFNAVVGAFLGALPGVSVRDKPSREEKRQDKRRRILKAAHAEFCAVGFDGASMDRLAHAADVSKPTLYQYFGDKEGLFSQVLERGKSHIVAPLMDSDGTLVDRLWRFSWTYADFVLRPDMLSLARLILGEASRRPDSAKRYHRNGPGNALNGLVDFITQCVAAGELAVDDADLAAHDLWSLILSGPRDHYLHHVADRPTQDELLRTIHHGLRVFLTAYSTHLATDMAELSRKADDKRQTLPSQGQGR